jgi:hypothetical protein
MKELIKFNKVLPKGDGPYIYGSFTNWQPIQMHEIKEYCDMIDQNKPDILE